MGDNGMDAVTYLPASLVRAVAEHPARSLPWCDTVVGTMVMADLSGKPAEALAPVSDRKFLEIDVDNFDELLTLTCTVDP